MTSEIKLDILQELVEFLDPQVEIDIKKNLLRLLEKKKVSMQISADCHTFLRDKYNKRAKIIGMFNIILSFVSFILSASGGGNNSIGTNINIPLAIITGLATAVSGIKQISYPSEKANAHDLNYKTAMDLEDDIEYIILKNNHTVKSLQHSLEVYEERIKSFRKSEEQIPIEVKERFATRILDQF
jgi:hypothetical protein